MDFSKAVNAAPGEGAKQASPRNIENRVVRESITTDQQQQNKRRCHEQHFSPLAGGGPGIESFHSEYGHERQRVREEPFSQRSSEPSFQKTVNCKLAEQRGSQQNRQSEAFCTVFFEPQK